jgi:SOS-response transcriptional repressor LexA
MQPFITLRERDVISGIEELSAAGRNPTLNELCARVGMRSTATLRHHLANLERKGIVRPRAYNRHRQIALIQPLAA